MKVTGFAWAGVGTENFERAVHFYTQILGLPVEFMGEKVAHLTVGPGQMLEIFGSGGEKDLNAIPTVAFAVEDFEAAREELIAADVELVGEVGRWEGHAWQYFRTPDGHLFEIKQVPARPS